MSPFYKNVDRYLLHTLLLLPALLAFLLACRKETSPVANLVATAAPPALTPTPLPSPTAAPPTQPFPTSTAIPTVWATATPTAVPTITSPRLMLEPLYFDHSFAVLPVAAMQAQTAAWLTLAEPADELTADQLALTTTAAKPVLTRTEAAEDTRYLFRLLKHGYAGYALFDENGRFEQAKDTILEGLAQQEWITAARLAELMADQLTFIEDGHFRLGDHRFGQHEDYWYWDGLDFFETDGRFWFQDEDTYCWLETVNGQPPVGYIKLSLNHEGMPVYRLGTLAVQQPPDFTLTGRCADGTETLIHAPWQHTPFILTDDTTYKLDTADAIPVVTIRRFWGNEQALRQFQEDATTLRDEPVVIVDIRGNGGGSDYWPMGWMVTLTGHYPHYPFLVSRLNTVTAVMGQINWATTSNVPNDARQQNQDDLAALTTGALPRGWSALPAAEPFTPIPNPGQLVVVLMDAGVASAGESFIGFLRQLENVVFIGENSGGVAQIGRFGVYYLPHSQLLVQAGSALFLAPDLTWLEGIGFMPDLWVPADRALPYALAAVQQGWLQPVKR